MMKTVVFTVLVIFLPAAVFCAADIKEVVFEETVIEGKIKKPQVVLISADQRPDFGSMAFSINRSGNRIIGPETEEVLESPLFKGPFGVGNRK